MLKAVERIKSLDIETFAPAMVHPSENRKQIISLTEKYAAGFYTDLECAGKKTYSHCVCSAYGYTKELLEIIGAAIMESAGFTMDIVDIENLTPTEMESYIISSDALLLGSPTINQNTLGRYTPCFQ